MPKMPTAERDEEAGPEKKGPDRQAAAVRLAVLNALGHPPGVLRVAVLRLWENHYRVNVQTGADAVSAVIAHSFFVAADADGNVLASTPEITRQY